MSDAARSAVLHVLVLIVSLVFVCAPALMVLTPDKHCRFIWKDEPAPNLCGFKIMTGHDCPGCGMTRCFVCMVHGNVLEAIHFHPWGAAAYMLLLSQIPYRIYALIRLRRGLPDWYFPYWTQVFCVFLGLYFVQWFIRLYYGA